MVLEKETSLIHACSEKCKPTPRALQKSLFPLLVKTADFVTSKNHEYVYDLASETEGPFLAASRGRFLSVLYRT